MDHPPGRSDRAISKTAIAGRLRLIRSEIFGEDGGPELADQLGIPHRTWSNYETGVTIPGEFLLLFLEITGAEPKWLLCGEGLRYRTPTSGLLGGAPVQEERRTARRAQRQSRLEPAESEEDAYSKEPSLAARLAGSSPEAGGFPPRPFGARSPVIQ
jgi:transcriptional regulator with XRE-family HTH domain